MLDLMYCHERDLDICWSIVFHRETVYKSSCYDLLLFVLLLLWFGLSKAF